jgi:serine protease AprX
MKYQKIFYSVDNLKQMLMTGGCFMIFQEVSWIRSNYNKFCPSLRKQALEWYRPFKHVPCFLQKFFKSVRQRFKRLSVIVQLEDSSEFSICLKSVAASSGCSCKHELPLINAFSTKVTAKKLENLIKENKVKKVWYDDKVHAVLDIASKVVESPTLWKNNITGKGITVAVLDTGIYNHPDLSGRIVGFKDFIKNNTKAYDDNGHGTHVAGDIASNGISSNSKYTGPAPEANLVGVKVLAKNGSGSLSTVIQGIQWCIDNKSVFGIRVINMSLGSTANQSYKDDPVCMAVEKAWKNGIVVCVAAGNEGPEEYTIGSPGIDPMIITVGAINDVNTEPTIDDFVASYSSRGPTLDKIEKPDIVAPGTNIISLRSPNSTLDKQNKSSRIGNQYFSLSGTSMATPICSGVVALMLQANSNLTPDEVKYKLKNTAIPLPNISGNVQGSGLIDAENATKNI